MNSKWKSFFVITMGALMLSANHIYNGFPLVLGDTRGYLLRGHFLLENSHWSNTYTLFLAFIFKVFHSVQGIAITQNIMVSAVLFISCKHLITFNYWKYLLIIGLLLTTSLTWTSTAILSDIFTPLSIICSILILLKPLKIYEWCIIGPILFIGISAHQSHLLMIPALVFLVVLSQRIFGQHLEGYLLKKFFIMLILFLCSNLVEKNILNHSSTKRFNPSAEQAKQIKDISSGYYFIAVRIAESGKLESLIRDYCVRTPDNYLCKETGKYDASRIRTTKYHERTEGNFEYYQYSKQTKEFVLFSLTKVKTYIGLSQMVIKRGFSLLRSTRIQPYLSLDDLPNRYIEEAITLISPNEVNAFVNSKQRNNQYQNFKFNTYYRWVFLWWRVLFPLSILLSVFLILKYREVEKFSLGNLLFLFYLFYGHILNTLICGTFSNHTNFRYSSRTLWLLCFSIILVFIYFYEYYNKPKLAKNHEVGSQSD